MRYSSLLLFLLFLTPLCAQFEADSYVVRVLSTKSKESYKAARSLNTSARESLGSKFILGSRTSFEIKPVINIGKAHLIEGMDVKASGEPQIEFQITDKKSKEKEIYIYKEKLSANTNAKLAEELVEAFASNSAEQEKLNDFVLNFINKVFEDNCSKYSEYIEKLNAERDYRKSINVLVNFSKSSCSTNANSLLSKTLKEQADYTCAEKIQKARIMVNSGVAFQFKRAIPILLSISPDAPCAEEAIELSKKIGEQVDQSSSIQVELSKYQSYQNNYSDWETYYIYQLLKEK